MREQGRAVRVSDRVEPVVRAHRLVDLDRLAGLQPDGFEAEVAGVHAPADRRKQLGALNRFAVLELDGDGSALARDRRCEAPDLDLDPALAERVVHGLRGELLLARDQARCALDDRHGRTERSPRLTELDADDAAAEDHEVLRHLLRGRALDVRPRLRLGEPRDRRQEGARAGRNDDRVSGGERAVAGLDAPLAGELRAAAHDRDAAFLEPGELDGVVQIVARASIPLTAVPSPSVLPSVSPTSEAP